MNISENIRKFRELNHMEQTDLALKLNISNKTISSWECGRTEPRMGMIEAMCEIFHCEKTELIDGVKSSQESRILKYAKLLSQMSPEKFSSVANYIDFLNKSEDKAKA